MIIKVWITCQSRLGRFYSCARRALLFFLLMLIDISLILFPRKLSIVWRSVSEDAIKHNYLLFWRNSLLRSTHFFLSRLKPINFSNALWSIINAWTSRYFRCTTFLCTYLLVSFILSTTHVTICSSLSASFLILLKLISFIICFIVAAVIFLVLIRRMMYNLKLLWQPMMVFKEVVLV